MDSSFQPVFARLREILQAESQKLIVGPDTADHYSLSAPMGPSVPPSRRGKNKNATMPVAWVRLGKNYVSFHLMGVYTNPKLLDNCSPALLARMQGKSCFNFKSVDEPLFQELARLTKKSLANLKKIGIIIAKKTV